MSRRRLGPIPAQQPRSGVALWEACCAGREPAESLDVQDREDLLRGLERAGWPRPAIALHTRTTPYTVDRILDRCRRAELTAMSWDQHLRAAA